MKIIIIITANRGRKSREIIDSFKRFNEKDLQIMESRMIVLVNDPNVEEIIFGGALGGDTVLLYYALKHRKGNVPNLTVILPVDLRFQARETWEITRQADEIIEMHQQIYDENGQFRKIIYKNRNVEMLKKAKKSGKKSKVEAFWNGQRMYSGTYSTIISAQKMGIPVNVNMIGAND